MMFIMQQCAEYMINIIVYAECRWGSSTPP